MDKAVLLLSGGLNSTVAAAAVRERFEIYPLFVSFSQRNAAHEACAVEQLCQHFEVQHHWAAELSHFKQVGGNATVDHTRRIEDATRMEGGVPATFVPGLMPTLLCTAVAFAQRIGAKAVVSGINEAIDQPLPGHTILCPDQRREFLYAYQYMLDAALPDRVSIRVEAPVIDFQRVEIIKLGRRLKVPFELTWSCYLDGEHPCGHCYGCASRAIGFAQAQEPDPLLLAMQQATPPTLKKVSG